MTEELINELETIRKRHPKPKGWAKKVAIDSTFSVRTVNAVLKGDRISIHIALCIIKYFKNYDEEISKKLQEVKS